MIIFLVKNFNLLIIFFKDLVRTLQHLQDCLEEVNKHQLFLVTQVLVQVIFLSMIFICSCLFDLHVYVYIQQRRNVWIIEWVLHLLLQVLFRQLQMERLSSSTLPPAKIQWSRMESAQTSIHGISASPQWKSTKAKV